MAGAVLLACALTAPPWLPWRNMVKEHAFSFSHPAFQPASALAPEDPSLFGRTAKGEARQLAMRKRMQRDYEAKHGPGVLEPYEPPEPDAPADARRAEPKPYLGKRTRQAQEEAQFPGRMHPPWWWEKPPRWLSELPWWLAEDPASLREALPRASGTPAQRTRIPPAFRAREVEADVT